MHSQLVAPEVYQQHLAKSIAQAENNAGNNAFHCKTPDCTGWCIYDDNVNNFLCPVCKINNCLTCQVRSPPPSPPHPHTHTHTAPRSFLLLLSHRDPRPPLRLPHQVTRCARDGRRPLSFLSVQTRRNSSWHLCSRLNARRSYRILNYLVSENVESSFETRVSFQDILRLGHFIKI
jgi:hypothetical protein